MSTEYFVASNLKHDEKDFVRGDKITLSEEQAKPLLAIKTIQTRPIRKEEPVMSFLKHRKWRFPPARARGAARRKQASRRWMAERKHQR